MGVPHDLGVEGGLGHSLSGALEVSLPPWRAEQHSVK